MALVINPDGTITTVEADYDRYGNLRPKIDTKILNDQVISYNLNTESENKVVNWKKKSGKKKSVSPVSAPKKVIKVRTISPAKRQAFISEAEIEMFFKDRIAGGKRITTEEYITLTDKLPPELRRYFIGRYRMYLSYKGMSPDDPRNRKKFKKTKNKKKSTKKKKSPHVIGDITKGQSNHSGFTIGDIATFSSMNKRTPDGDMVNGKWLLGASRKPKYGYARDRYGRVQERDSFNEERRNEFHSAQNHQRNYDYSSYDPNDDHDGAYNDWE